MCWFFMAKKEGFEMAFDMNTVNPLDYLKTDISISVQAELSIYK